MKSINKLQNIILLSAVFFLSITPLNAQQNISAATLSGTIEDSNGASVRGVSVIAANLETNRSQTAISDENGRFRFAYLPVGNYEIKADANGFTPLKQKLTATVGQALEIKLQLQIEEVSAQVEVSGRHADY